MSNMLTGLHFGDGLLANWASLMIRVMWQGSFTLALFWLLNRLFPKIHPALRCWLWRIAYIKMFLSSLWIIPLRIPVFPPLQELAATLAGLANLGPDIQWIHINQANFQQHASRFSFFFDIRFWFSLWVFGAVFFGCRLFFGWRQKQKIVRNCYEVDHPNLTQPYSQFTKQLKLYRQPQLLVSDAINSPLLTGIFRPKLILPVAIVNQYTEEEIKLIIAHELAHLKRCDLLWNWLPTFIQGLFFFNPLIWLVHREWLRVQEICCDRLAIHFSQAMAIDYGDLLLKVTAQYRRNLRSGLAAFYVSQSTVTLKKRLIAILQIDYVSKWQMMIAGFALALFSLLVILPWQLTQGVSIPVYLKVIYSGVPATTVRVSACFSAPQRVSIKKVHFFVDNQIIAGTSNSINFFEGSSMNMYKNFTPEGLHRVTINATTTAGSYRKNYIFDYIDSFDNWLQLSL